MKPFLDTNILVYAALSDDPRRPTAERLLAAGGTISVQVIVVSAIEAGCDTLYTEDMQHGRTIGKLAIVNPFLEGAP